jgi:hypothetical protein
MDNSNASKFVSSLHEITQQEQFFHDIQNMITTLHVKPFHLFDETFQFLSMLKEMLHTFLYIFYKEERRKLRREWIQKQHGHEIFLS